MAELTSSEQADECGLFLAKARNFLNHAGSGTHQVGYPNIQQGPSHSLQHKYDNSPPSGIKLKDTYTFGV
jgi:hypothetical protein